ncbi:MYCBP-associated protein isoform X2 [Erinaceus europaeus]|uniref:MYCBP-associated protein isoform X2 n=1 Tax=Erinaceus europaeus TaxID=9365 RepID=A0ABM3YF41_ERIEU|nr:MYCBP-associated protein isoform X2 [Erinaceus europaeus]
MKKVAAKLSPTKVLDKKRTKVPEQLTPPIQEEPETVSNVLQGDDILALAIKKEDLKKQHIPRLPEAEDRPAIRQKFVIRKLKPKDSRRRVCHLVAHPATPDAATKPLDYSGPGGRFCGGDQILPHHILGSLQDFKRIAVARGNNELAEMIHIPSYEVLFIISKEEPKQKVSKEEKTVPWAPPPQHNFLKNWQRNIALRKKQQEALSEHLGKPVSELLMNTGETYRRIQEERELIDRALPTQHDRKVCEETVGFWSPLDYLGDEMTGLLMTKTKAQRGLLEPITHIRKPRSIQLETGLQAQRQATYRYTWDRSLFLIYRRKELQSIMAELDFSQQVGNVSVPRCKAPGREPIFSRLIVLSALSKDIDGLEVVGRGQPFSTITVEDFLVSEQNQESSSEDTISFDIKTSQSDMASMPILGPSLLFCGKPACWIRGSTPEDKKHIGIAVRLTFETVEGEKTSSELTVVNNGTVAIWYHWRRQSQQDSFQDMKRNRMQRFYFNNQEGVILPRETKTFTFFFKSLNAGIFRESWQFGTHPTLLGGAILQVNLHAISLTQDLFRDERKLLESKLAIHEAVTIVKSVLQEMLGGILTPERAQSPVDAYLTEEDVFHHRNPQLHYQHQVVQSLHRLWLQYITPPPKIEETKTEEARSRDEENTSSKARAARGQSSFLDKTLISAEPLTPVKSSMLELQVPKQETEAQDSFGSQKLGTGSRIFRQKSIMEEILVVASPDPESFKSSPSRTWELGGLSSPEWNLCLEDFRKAIMVLPEESQREDALIRLNRAALELCQEQRPLQSDLLYQICLQLWRDMIDSLVSYSLWLRALLGLPEKETVYLDMPEEQDQKSLPSTETKVTSGRIGKEDKRGTTQEKRQMSIREEKKASKSPGKEDRLNSKKQKAKDDKKPAKSVSRDRIFLEDPVPDSTVPSQEPIDPLVMKKYTQRLYTEVYGLLDTLLTDLMVLADELGPIKNSEDPLRLCT